MTALLLPGIAFPEVMTCSPGYLQRRSTRCSIVSIPGWSMARLKHGVPMAPHAYWVAVSRGECARSTCIAGAHWCGWACPGWPHGIAARAEGRRVGERGGRKGGTG